MKKLLTLILVCSLFISCTDDGTTDGPKRTSEPARDYLIDTEPPGKPPAAQMALFGLVSLFAACGVVLVGAAKPDKNDPYGDPYQKIQ